MVRVLSLEKLCLVQSLEVIVEIRQQSALYCH